MWYLCYFYHRHLGFRREEVQALADLAGCGEQLEWKPPYGGDEAKDSPFWYVNIPTEEQAALIANRSVLIKGIYDLWGEGTTWEEMEAAIKACPAERKDPYTAEDCVFKIIVEGFGQTVPHKQQMDYIHKLEFIDYKGPVNMKNPQQTFNLIETANANHNNGLFANVPKRFYYGREIGVGDRSPMSKYALSNRSYIGPTSMDVELCMIMCNMGGVKAGDLVYDPFVGTGSILVAASHFGATTIGADIDIRVVRDGKTNKRGRYSDVWSNFDDYGFPHPVGLMRYDAHRPPLRQNLQEIFDCIVCDPPYGVRAGGRKSGGRKPKELQREIPEDKRATHIPSTAPYTLSECLLDLLVFAAKYLRIGGRLVYWLPSAVETYTDDDVPQHPCLTLVANSEQLLTRRWGRRLITVKKHRAYDASLPVQVPTNTCPDVNELKSDKGDKEGASGGGAATLRDIVFKKGPDGPAEDHKKLSAEGAKRKKKEPILDRPLYRGKHC